MNAPSELRDPTDFELDDRELTAALQHGLMDLRPDPAEFAEGVRRRVQTRRTATPRLSPFLRTAAAILPAAMLPKGLVAATPAVTTKVGAKWLATVALMPIATLAAIALTAVALARHLAVRTVAAQQRDDAASARNEIRSWWKAHRLGAAATPIAFVTLLWFAPAMAVALLLLAAALTLSLLWQQLAAAGLATRAEIGTMAGRWLETLSIHSLMLVAMLGAPEPLPIHVFGSTDQLGARLMAPLLLLGAILCHAFSRSGKRYVARHAFWAAMIVAIGWGPGFLLPEKAPPVRSPLGWEAAATASIATPDFAAIAEMATSLQLAGTPAPTAAELAPFHQNVDPTAFSYAAHAVLDLGLSTKEQQRAWLARFSGNPADENRLTYRELVTSPAEMLRYRLAARAELLLPTERDRIVAALLAAFANPGQHDSLARLLAAAATLDELGADGMALQQRAHELLRATAADAVPTQGVGFTDTRRADATPLPADACNPIHSARAVLLLARFSAPEDLDLTALDRHLQRMCAPRATPVQFGNYAAFAGLLALRAQPGHVAFEPTVLDRAARGMVMGAVVLLVLFAIAATLRTKPAN